MSLPKTKTSPEVYVSHFQQILSNYNENNLLPVFTDGSKTAYCTSYSVVNPEYKIDVIALIGNNCSIFNAESTAILAAVNIYKSKQPKPL